MRKKPNIVPDQPLINFVQKKDGYYSSTKIVYNDQEIEGKWLVRLTSSQKMWVLEFYRNQTIFLPAQTVFLDSSEAMALAAKGSINGLTGNNGKWFVSKDKNNRNQPRYSVEKIPESKINWL